MNMFDTPDAGVGLEARTVVATVLAERHPSLPNRVRLAWEEADGTAAADWAVPLRGVLPRPRDRVLAVFPGNGAGPVVTGILDRLVDAETPPAEDGPRLRLAPGEALRIAGPDGRPWLEIAEDPEGGGPRLRFLVPPEGLDLPGTLRLAADAIEIEARRGEIRMDAHGDVRVSGEIVHLN